MVWPWSLSPLAQRPDFAPVKGPNGPRAETITIRPDAKTGNRSWPCRELNVQRTPNPRYGRSRFGECLLWQVSRLNCGAIRPTGLPQPLSCRARCGGLDTQSNEKRRQDTENVMNTVDRRPILTPGALARAGAATQGSRAEAQAGPKPIFAVPA